MSPAPAPATAPGPQMSQELAQAFQIVSQVCASAHLPAQGHQQWQQALEHIAQAALAGLPKPEPKKASE